MWEQRRKNPASCRENWQSIRYAKIYLIYCNKDGKIQYVVLEGEAGHQDAIIRTDNAVETLKSNGIALEKLSYQIANWNRAQAQNRMEQINRPVSEQDRACSGKQ